MEKYPIHVVSTYFLPVQGGLENNIYQVYTRLAKQGWDVTVHTSNRGPNSKKTFPKKELMDGIKVRRYNYIVFSLLPFFRLNLFKTSLIVVKDIIIFPGIFIFSIAYLFKTLGLKRFGLTLSEHGLFSYSPHLYPGLKMRIKRVIDRSVNVFLINMTVDSIRAVSAKIKQDLIAGGIIENKIRIINNGLDDLAFQDVVGLASEPVRALVQNMSPYILQVGRVDRVKNLQATIRAFQYLAEEIKLIFVGHIANKNYRNDLIYLANTLHLEKRVIFAGSFYGADKYYIMKNALACVSSSKNEGYGLVILEALSQGAICIVNKGTAIEELVADKVNGFVVDFDNAKEVAGSIERISQEPNRIVMNEVRSKAIESVQGKTWNKTAAEIEKMYHGIMEAIV